MAIVRVKNIHTVKRADGTQYHYHRITREPLPADPEKRAARALAINMEIEAKKAEAKEAGQDSVSALIRQYRASPDFLSKAQQTRRNYELYMVWLEDEFGGEPAREVANKEFVLDVRDLFAATPRKADMMVRMLSILFGYAMERPKRYKIEANPCERVKKLYKAGEGYRPWPDDVQARFFAAAYKELRWITEATLYLGQRGGDMVKMSTANLAGQTATVTQAKTGKPLEIPKHPRLKEILAEMPKSEHLIAFTTATGRPWKETHLRHEIQAVMSEIKEEGYSLHGLRKNAVNRLLEAGCTVPETSAITGQSLQMVEHYARRVQQKSLAQSAIRKLTAADRKKARKSAKK